MDSQLLTIEPIAIIHNQYTDRFAIPRQSGSTDLLSVVVFLPKYRDENSLRHIEEFSHLWLIWHFSEIHQEGWSPTVRPPKLGGNKRVGVFASRSPYRPNALGLSHVKLIGVRKTKEDGAVLLVEGGDLMDKTPIFDIKPYLKSDAVQGAKGGYAVDANTFLKVDFEGQAWENLSPEERQRLASVLREDPRPGYQNDERRYAFFFDRYEVFFQIKDGTVYLDEIKNAAD
ncbi:MAG: tRNA (N6-threonylcarbamoyladenosine(37)-N6)-methyltransferase TrmO [Christensenellales bacterium]